MHLLSQGVTYATVALIHLAGGGVARRLPGHAIARACRIPEFWTAHLLRALVKNGVLLSGRGSAGGYALARPAGQITLLDVVEAIDGPVLPQRFDDRPGLAHVARRLAQSLRHELGRASIAELARPS